MYCWKCGSQVEEGSHFCPKCGTDLTQHQQQAASAPVEKPNAQPQPVSQPAAQKKKGGFKKIVISACIVGIMYLIGSYVGQQMAGGTKQGSSKAPAASSASTGKQSVSSAASSALTDLITRHAVLMDEENASLRQYQVLYYGNDTHRLKAWSIVLVGKKSAGYSVNGLRSLYKQEEWPSFAEVRYFDDTDYAVASYDLKNLESAQRIRELIQYELLAAMPESEIAKGAVDVDHLIESAKELGYKDANILDYSLLHLN